MSVHVVHHGGHLLDTWKPLCRKDRDTTDTIWRPRTHGGNIFSHVHAPDYFLACTKEVDHVSS